MNTYPDIVAGIRAALATVPGLTILAFEPPTVQATKCVYFLLDSGTHEYAAQRQATTYRIIARLCLRWQVPEEAELQMAALIEPIISAIDSDPFLGGRITRGTARIETFQAGYADFGKVGSATHRTCDFNISVTNK